MLAHGQSWYILFFQLPRIPEALSRRRDWYVMREALLRTSREGTFSEADLARYREAWAQPGAITAMIDWYRAMARHAPPTPTSARVRVPTLILWGAQDAFLSREMASRSTDLCDDGRLVMFEDATHWVQHEEADEVNRKLLAFFARGDPAERA